MNALRAAAVIGFMWCGRHYVTYAVTLNGRVEDGALRLAWQASLAWPSLNRMHERRLHRRADDPGDGAPGPRVESLELRPGLVQP